MLEQTRFSLNSAKTLKIKIKVKNKGTDQCKQKEIKIKIIGGCVFNT